MDRRLAAAGSVVGHKMSMLQDLERSRSLEIDALVTVVQELGRLTGVATPSARIDHQRIIDLARMILYSTTLNLLD